MFPLLSEAFLFMIDMAEPGHCINKRKFTFHPFTIYGFTFPFTQIVKAKLGCVRSSAPGDFQSICLIGKQNRSRVNDDSFSSEVVTASVPIKMIAFRRDFCVCLTQIKSGTFVAFSRIMKLGNSSCNDQNLNYSTVLRNCYVNESLNYIKQLGLEDNLRLKRSFLMETLCPQ